MKDPADSTANMVEALIDKGLQDTPPATEQAIVVERGTAAIRGSSLPSIDTVRSTLEGISLSADEVGHVLWFLNYGKTKGMRSYGELGDLIGYDASTMSRIINGKYGAKYDSVIAKIEGFKTVRMEREKVGSIPFIETRLAKELWQICEFIRVSQTIGFIHGPNQSGKTTALEEHQRRNNHGRTIFVRMPAGGSLAKYTEALAKAAGISHGERTYALHQRMLKHCRPEMLLIIDEAHQLFEHGLKLQTLEHIRELHDLTGMGVVLCGTDVLADSLESPKYKGFIGQFVNRGTVRRLIKPEPYRDDVIAFCDAFGLGIPPQGTDAEREVFAIANGSGVGKLSKICQMAQRLAANRQEVCNWEHVLTTASTLRNWEKGETKGGRK